MKDKVMSWIQQVFIVAHEQSLSTNYSRTSVARTLMTRLPRLFQTLS